MKKLVSLFIVLGIAFVTPMVTFASGPYGGSQYDNYYGGTNNRNAYPYPVKYQCMTLMCLMYGIDQSSSVLRLGANDYVSVRGPFSAYFSPFNNSFPTVYDPNFYTTGNYNPYGSYYSDPYGGYYGSQYGGYYGDTYGGYYGDPYAGYYSDPYSGYYGDPYGGYPQDSYIDPYTYNAGGCGGGLFGSLGFIFGNGSSLNLYGGC